MIAGIDRSKSHAPTFVTERSPLDEHHAPRNLRKDLLAMMSGEIREHPMPVLVSAITLGVLLGCLLMSSRKPA
jgi:hypothetical protein